MDSATWQQLEEYVARLLENKGFSNVRRVGGSGDRGADILAEHEDPLKNTVRYVVQCKHKPDQKVGSQEVRLLHTDLELHHADRGIFVTSSDFTDEAKEVARRLRITLIDGTTLENELLQQQIIPPQYERPPVSASAEPAFVVLPRQADRWGDVRFGIVVAFAMVASGAVTFMALTQKAYAIAALFGLVLAALAYVVFVIRPYQKDQWADVRFLLVAIFATVASGVGSAISFGQNQYALAGFFCVAMCALGYAVYKELQKYLSKKHIQPEVAPATSETVTPVSVETKTEMPLRNGLILSVSVFIMVVIVRGNLAEAVGFGVLMGILYLVMQRTFHKQSAATPE